MASDIRGRHRAQGDQHTCFIHACAALVWILEAYALALIVLSAPPVARIPDLQKSTQVTGSFSCHTICSVFTRMAMHTRGRCCGGLVRFKEQLCEHQLLWRFLHSVLQARVYLHPQTLASLCALRLMRFWKFRTLSVEPTLLPGAHFHQIFVKASGRVIPDSTCSGSLCTALHRANMLRAYRATSCLRNQLASVSAASAAGPSYTWASTRTFTSSSASVCSSSSATGSPPGPMSTASHQNLDDAASVASPATVDICEYLLSKLNDRTLLHSAGLIGGKWLGAWNNATYEVRMWLLAWAAWEACMVACEACTAAQGCACMHQQRPMCGISDQSAGRYIRGPCAHTRSWGLVWPMLPCAHTCCRSATQPTGKSSPQCR